MRFYACLLSLLLAPASLSAAYTYWLTDYFSGLNPVTWHFNGPSSGGSNGFYSNGSPDATAILKTAVPDGTGEYEVRAKLKIPSAGGSYILYLRASDNAQIIPNGTPIGQFIALEVKNPTYTNGVCTATLNAWRAVGGALSLLGGTTIPCYDGMEVRGVSTPLRIRFYLDEVFYFSHLETVIYGGKPGIGGFGMPSGNGISRVDLGSLDRVAPVLSATSIATAVFDTRGEIQWSPADDGPNGVGIFGYHYFRNNTYMGIRRNAEIVDLTVTPGTTYTYELQPEDFHGNLGLRTAISVTTPAAGNIDPRRTGVRPLGTYWGGLGEQIDLQSGNVNFSMPLFQAQARGGWGVTFALSYNSQNWRRDTAGTARTWNHGRDIGYGYGWRFMAGAMTPLFTSYWNIGMYRFMDSSGAEYRLTETAPGSGEWVAKDGLFITYKPAEGRLYFPDGSWWYFGSIAGSAEMDLGTRYPTLFQDRNGNQIKVRYRPARGGTQINGSGRIWQVEDVRQWAAGGATYECNYVNDSLQHLNSCVTVGNLKTGENYQVGIGAASPLTDPFLGQSFGDKQVLGGITNISDGINAPFYFGYDNGASSGPGELTAAVFPYGGSLHWGYATGTLAGGRQFRKVSTRAYNANDGQGGKTAYLHFYPGSNAQLPVHEWTVLQDPTLTADKAWWWHTGLGTPEMGLNRNQSDRKMPVSVDVAQREIVWSLTSNGNPYISRVTETMDPGHADAKVRRTEQAINEYGNLMWRKEYAYGSTTVLARESLVSKLAQRSDG